MDHQDFVEEITGHYQMFIEPYMDEFKKRETKKEANEIRSIWRSRRPADETAGGNLKGSVTSVENKGTRHETARAMKREMEAMSRMAMECKIRFRKMLQMWPSWAPSAALQNSRKRLGNVCRNGYSRNEKQGGTHGAKRHRSGQACPEILNDIANNNRKRKPDTELDRKYKKFAETITALDVSKPEEELIGQYYDGIEKNDAELEEDLRRIKKPVSWADMCETSDDESNHEDNDNDDEDDFWNDDEKDKKKESDTTEYRMDTPRGLSIGSGRRSFHGEFQQN
ncbi:hypothetical protein MHU86_22877 [Fragilaria crotonensis]|nr:hypothetical protein MHU86_22877 [Fragilaria crotonensis]